MTMTPVSYLTWDDLHRTGDAEIDRQHQWLVSDFNAVANALRQVGDRRLISKTFDNFFRTTESHFACEENKMAHSGFPDLEVHRERHRNYLGRLSSLRDRYNRGEDITDEMISYFISWTSHHIATTDTKFGEFLKSNNGP